MTLLEFGKWFEKQYTSHNDIIFIFEVIGILLEMYPNYREELEYVANTSTITERGTGKMFNWVGILQKVNDNRPVSKENRICNLRCGVEQLQDKTSSSDNAV